uniref:Cytochrome c biogenesis protein Ccs1 n=1 Tax=Scinaia undulata TaxID=1884664 RepID=A0A1G4NXG0_9FLOR|nr:Cytochrome c biogenesis protein ccs1 [Scinaia undulata]SCW23294.1 Cytochrome c biogenesis protein ccs1 [Scinaia undulata]
MIYKIFRWKAFRLLGNLTFSILLLLSISAISIIGTIIEQDRGIDYYQLKYPVNTSVNFNFSWEIIKLYQLDKLYSSWAFITIIIIFALSLITCTFSTQLPSLKYARKWKLRKEIPEAQAVYSQKYNIYCTPSPVIYSLNYIRYYVFYQKKYIYSYQGLYGKLAPVFVHISLISLLAGSLGSLFMSFYIQEIIPSGEHFNLQNAVQAGPLSIIPTKITGKVNNFFIEYYSNGSIKQFYSDLTIHNHTNQKVKTNLISVNNPLKFEKLTIYQTDWQINGIRLSIGNSGPIQIPLFKIINKNNEHWGTTLNYAKNRQISILVTGPDQMIECYNINGQLIKKFNLKENITIDHIPIHIDNIITSTGLQIKQDPGLPVVYASFFLLMTSTFTSYLSYSQLWIIQNSSGIYISGRTNRAYVKFEEDVAYISKQISLRT